MLGSPLKPGQDFGSRYRIEEYVGEGGMGKVYKAYDRDLNRVVALKIIRPELAADPACVQRFKKEILLASTISDRNILRIHDLGEANGVKFISMAYVEGEDLAVLIRRSKRIPLPRAIEIGLQLCDALEAAHLAGVAHRDLKPKNILIDGAGCVFVSDFGLAKSLEAESPGMTRTGEMIGTPLYMSPEQVEGRPADHRSDIYALGLILYEMVTGDVPFSANSSLQTMYRRLKERPKDPRSVNPDLPASMAILILRCLEKDPELRYHSAKDVGAGLALVSAAPPRNSLLRSALRGPRTAVAALLVLAVGFSVPVLRRAVSSAPGPAATKASQEKYMAVLPLQVLGGDDALKYQAQGITEALEAKLFPLRSVHLASPVAVQRSMSKGSVEQIGKDLGVRFVINGTLQRVGDRLRIIVKVQDLPAGRLVWEKAFSGLPQDLLTIEDEIYQQLTAILGLEIGSEEMARAASRPTEQADAYEAYLKGRSIIRATRDPVELKRGVTYFEQAIAKDPSFALAHAGVADACILLYELTKDKVWPERALAAAREAKILNDNLPEVHFRARQRQYSPAEQPKLSPNCSVRFNSLRIPTKPGGGSAARTPEWENNRKQSGVFEKAVAVNPYYWFNYNQLGGAYFRNGDNKRAAEAFRRVAELEPDSVTGYINLGMALYRQGKWEQALERFQKALAIKPSATIYADLGLVNFYLGRYNEAMGMHQKALELEPESALALAAGVADDAPLALDRLERPPALPAGLLCEAHRRYPG